MTTDRKGGAVSGLGSEQATPDTAMSHQEHRDELRRICFPHPDDGPFVRELKALLDPDGEEEK